MSSWQGALDPAPPGSAVGCGVAGQDPAKTATAWAVTPRKRSTARASKQMRSPGGKASWMDHLLEL